jgi:hypothetical protein
MAKIRHIAIKVEDQEKTPSGQSVDVSVHGWKA